MGNIFKRRSIRYFVLGMIAITTLIVIGFGALAFSFWNQDYTVLDDRYEPRSVVSEDGTIIGYYKIGEGPAVVLVHGGMQSAQGFAELAELLADDFTVHVYDRRGRGASGPFGDDHSMRDAIEDLNAVVTETGAQNVFGVSVGGLITLEAARSLPMVEKAAIYEPGLSIDGSTPLAWLEPYDQEMGEGRIAEALSIGARGAQFVPGWMPNWLLVLMTKLQMTIEDREAPSEYVTWRELAPTLGPDASLLLEMSKRADGTVETFDAVPAEVLLLGGSESSAYQETSLDALEKVLPHVKRVELQRLDHGGAGNSNKGGSPEQVAQELRQFFTSQ